MKQFQCSIIKAVEDAQRAKDILFAAWGVVFWLLGATLLAGGLIK